MAQEADEMIAALLLRFWPYIAIAALSAGLYWQIGKTATERAENETLIGVNQTQTETIERQKRESALSEVVLVAHAGKVETITVEKEVIKNRVREIIKHAPASDCLNQPVPDDIVRLLGSDKD